MLNSNMIESLSFLEIHLVREHSFANGEGRSQVLAEELLLGVLLEGADQLTVHFDLVLLALFGDDVGGLLLLEDFAFAMTDLLGLGATEVVVVQSLGDRDARNVDLGLGGNDVDLVDPSKRASVDAERTGDEQKTGSQLLQEHHALSFVDAGHEDQDSAGSDRRTQLTGVLAERLFVRGLSLLTGLRGQSAGSLVELNDALVAILLAADLLLHRRCLLGDRRLLSPLVLDKSGLLVIHLGSGKPHDPTIDLNVAGSVSHGYFFFVVFKYFYLKIFN